MRGFACRTWQQQQHSKDSMPSTGLPGQSVAASQLAAQQLHGVGEDLRRWRQQGGALAQLEQGGKSQRRACT